MAFVFRTTFRQPSGVYTQDSDTEIVDFDGGNKSQIIFSSRTVLIGEKILLKCREVFLAKHQRLSFIDVGQKSINIIPAL